MPDMMTENEIKDLAKAYIKKVVEALSNPEEINKAVRDRQILIKDPTKNTDNRETLQTLFDQFDPATGTKAQGATYGFHDPKRTADEAARFINPGSSDWSHVAQVAAYFKGSELISPNKTSNQCLDIIQIIVANELRDVFGFTEPRGYELNNDTKVKLDSLLSEKSLNLIATKTTAILQFKTDYNNKLAKTEILFDLKKHYKAIEAREKPHTELAPALKENYNEKKALLNEAIRALSQYNVNYDVVELNQSIDALAQQDKERRTIGIFHPTSSLIKAAKSLVKDVTKEHEDKDLQTSLSSSTSLLIDLSPRAESPSTEVPITPASLERSRSNLKKTDIDEKKEDEATPRMKH
jgi:hypothetical protein